MWKKSTVLFKKKVQKPNINRNLFWFIPLPFLRVKLVLQIKTENHFASTGTFKFMTTDGYDSTKWSLELDTSEILKSQNKPCNLLKVFLTRYLPRSSTHILILKTNLFVLIFLLEISHLILEFMFTAVHKSSIGLWR